MAPITNALRITGSRSKGKRPAGSTAATWLTVNGTGPWYVRPSQDETRQLSAASCPSDLGSSAGKSAQPAAEPPHIHPGQPDATVADLRMTCPHACRAGKQPTSHLPWALPSEKLEEDVLGDGGVYERPIHLLLSRYSVLWRSPPTEGRRCLGLN